MAAIKHLPDADGACLAQRFLGKPVYVGILKIVRFSFTSLLKSDSMMLSLS